MKNRLIVDIYWCALSATCRCCKTFTIIHAQNIVVQKIFVRAEGDAAASPAGSATAFGIAKLRSSKHRVENMQQKIYSS